jgi:hypothetical protein
MRGGGACCDLDVVAHEDEGGAKVCPFHNVRIEGDTGRSDADLGQRLVSSASQGDYSYFWFDYATSERDCYLKECKLYHRYNPPDNTVHPAVPPGTSWRCPENGCEWG